MMPIDDEKRKLLIQSLMNEVDTILGSEKEGDDHKALVKWSGEVRALHDAILDNRYVVFDTAPQCMVTIKDQGRCANAGNYAPFIVIYGQDGKTPVCQAETTPPLRVCKEHATNDVDHYLPPENWHDISAQAVRATGQLVRREDARVMFLDTESGQMVPPPSVSIAKAR